MCVLTLPSHHDYLLGQLVQHHPLVPLNDKRNTNKFINTLHLPSGIVRHNELVHTQSNLNFLPKYSQEKSTCVASYPSYLCC